jgi:hypothetical protein
MSDAPVPRGWASIRLISRKSYVGVEAACASSDLERTYLQIVWYRGPGTRGQLALRRTERRCSYCVQRNLARESRLDPSTNTPGKARLGLGSSPVTHPSDGAGRGLIAPYLLTVLRTLAGGRGPRVASSGAPTMRGDAWVGHRPRRAAWASSQSRQQAARPRRQSSRTLAAQSAR